MEIGLIHIFYAVVFYAAILLYSTIVNVFCGHRSFWRNSLKIKTFIDGLGASFILELVQELVYSSRGSLYSALGRSACKVRRGFNNNVNQSVSHVEKACTVAKIEQDNALIHRSFLCTNDSSQGRVTAAARCMLVNIGQDMLIEIGTYMDISDAASTASTCKSLHACYTSPLMWPVLISTHFDVNILEKSGISISKPSELAWDEIYELLAKYPKILCAHLPGVHVIIDGAVYDVTGFIDSHPGGDGLLYEYNGADASRVYHLAMHSDQAEIMRAKFLVWSPPQRALPIILRVYKTLTASSASNHMGHGITASVRVNTFLAGTLEKVKVFVHKFIQ